jgi:hypothetical protein
VATRCLSCLGLREDGFSLRFHALFNGDDASRFLGGAKGLRPSHRHHPFR